MERIKSIGKFIGASILILVLVLIWGNVMVLDHVGAVLGEMFVYSLITGVLVTVVGIVLGSFYVRFAQYRKPRGIMELLFFWTYAPMAWQVAVEIGQNDTEFIIMCFLAMIAVIVIIAAGPIYNETKGN